MTTSRTTTTSSSSSSSSSSAAAPAAAMPAAEASGWERGLTLVQLIIISEFKGIVVSAITAFGLDCMSLPSMLVGKLEVVGLM